MSDLPREPPPEARQPDGTWSMTMEDGSTVTWSRRPDGTWRKPERRRAGFVGELEQQKYVNPARRNGAVPDPEFDRAGIPFSVPGMPPPQTVPGMGPDTFPSLGESMSKSSKRNERRKEQRAAVREEKLLQAIMEGSGAPTGQPASPPAPAAAPAPSEEPKAPAPAPPPGREPPPDAKKQPDGSVLQICEDGTTLRWSRRNDGSWRPPEKTRGPGPGLVAEGHGAPAAQPPPREEPKAAPAPVPGREPPPDAKKQPDGTVLQICEDGSMLRWSKRKDGSWRPPEKTRGPGGGLGAEARRSANGADGLANKMSGLRIGGDGSLRGPSDPVSRGPNKVPTSYQ